MVTPIKDNMDKVIETLTTTYKDKFWQDKIKTRKETIQNLHSEMNRIFNKEIALNMDSIPHYYNQWTTSSNSRYERYTDTIVLDGKISLITYLHEYGHALGFKKESQAQQFSIYIFEKAYPDKFAKLIPTRNGALFINPNAFQSGQVTRPLTLPETELEPTQQTLPETEFDMTALAENIEIIEHTNPTEKSIVDESECWKYKFPTTKPQPIERPEEE